jgi:hypothetical protein
LMTSGNRRAAVLVTPKEIRFRIAKPSWMGSRQGCKIILCSARVEQVMGELPCDIRGGGASAASEGAESFD